MSQGNWTKKAYPVSVPSLPISPLEKKAERLLIRVLRRTPALKELIRYVGMWGTDDVAHTRAPVGRQWKARAQLLLERDEKAGTKTAEAKLYGQMHRALLDLRERQEQERGRAVERALVARQREIVQEAESVELPSGTSIARLARMPATWRV